MSAMNRLSLNVLQSNWVKVREIQNLGIVKSMYLWLVIVPLIAKGFAGIGDTVELVIFQYPVTVNLDLPFSWVVFYLSATAFVIANIFYQLFCPRLIRDHPHYASFESSKKDRTHLVGYYGELNPSGGFDSVFGLEPHTSANTSNPDVFWTLFDEANSKHRLFRIVASLLGYLGFLLIGYVALQNAWAVYQIAMS